MVRNARLPEVPVLLKHLNDGMTYKQIGEKYGVTDEAVRLACKRHGIKLPRLRNNHAQYIPWRIRSDHASDAIVRRLRLYSRKQQGLPLSEKDQQMLDEFEAFMKGANPKGLELSVNYGYNDDDGFWFQPKVAGDHNYIHPPAVPRLR